MANEIKVVFGEGLKVDVEIKGFTVKTDQPIHQGGANTAPSPFDYFLGSIAACAGFYVLAFCRERRIPTEDVDVSMDVERGRESKMVEKIRISIDLPASFPEKYKPALVKAVDNCTVKAHIVRAPAFEITARTKN